MKILIVEDEYIIATRIKRFATEFLGRNLVSIHIVEGIDEAREYLSNYSIDLLLLDLNLNGEDGFDILKQMVANSFDTIVISAYSDRAITAFEYGVLDFVEKPFNQKRLEKAFHKIRNHHHRQNQLKYLYVTKRGRIEIIKCNDILYVKGAGTYSDIFLQNGRKEVHTKSLDKLIKLLPLNFERVHKSYILDRNKCLRIHVYPGAKYKIELESNVMIPLGRTYYKEIKEKWFK